MNILKNTNTQGYIENLHMQNYTHIFYENNTKIPYIHIPRLQQQHLENIHVYTGSLEYVENNFEKNTQI